jgi:acyl-CoA thioesterase I
MIREIAIAAGAVGALAAGALALEARRRRWVPRLTATIPGLHVAWRTRSKEGELLYVAIGDSTALGVGASDHEHSYVGLLASAIEQRTGRTVRVRNLAIDGATLAVCISDELPRLAKIKPDICTVGIGANDVWTFEPERFRREIDTVLDALPASTIVADLPSFSPLPVERRAVAANRILREAVAAHGLTLAPLHAATRLGGPLATIRGSGPDLFHPNDRGYRRWVRGFLPAVLRAADALSAARTTAESD